ncbi:LptF/LptG family permease [Cardinium endosymbiont of Tipula unca]|uniref:LptF/LptG family permease n=1 Tax=Cardinium endosymbiont of Tipula unca TaxID=3066216 RepID=UPI0030D1E472
MGNFAIKKIDKLLLRSFIITFVSLLALVLFVLVTHSFFLILNSIVGKGLGFCVYAKLLFYIGVSMFPNAFPIAVLVAALIVFGNLSESFELTAMRSVGMSLQRIFLFPFIFILLLSSALFYFQDYIHPSSKHKIFSLVEDVVRKKSSLFIQEGVFCNNIPGYGIRVDKKLNDNGEIKGVVVYDHTQSYGTVTITSAKKGKLYTTPDENYLVMELDNGHNYVEALPGSQDNFSEEKQTFYRSSFASQKISIGLDALKLGKTQSEFAHDPRTRIHSQLKKMIKKRGERIENQAKYCKDLLAQKALHYDVIQQKAICKADALEIEKAEASTQHAVPTKDAGFISFRNQLVEIATNINGHRKENDCFTKQVVGDSLRAVDKLKKTLLEQRYYEVAITESLRNALFEKERRLAIAMQCIVMFLLAAPLGCVVRRGGFGISVVISLFFILLEYILAMFGRDWAVVGTISTFTGAWLANLVLLPFCFFFLIKAQKGTDLSLLSGWYSFWVKIKKVVNIKRNVMPHMGH